VFLSAWTSRSGPLVGCGNVPPGEGRNRECATGFGLQEGCSVGARGFVYGQRRGQAQHRQHRFGDFLTEARGFCAREEARVSRAGSPATLDMPSAQILCNRSPLALTFAALTGRVGRAD
jgi:hypothetical protein